MRDLTKTMEIMREAEEEGAAEADPVENEAPRAEIHEKDSGTPPAGQPKRVFVPSAAGTSATTSATPAAQQSHSAPSSLAPEKELDVPPRSTTSTPRPGQHLLTERPDDEQREVDSTAGDKGKDKRKGGLSKEQRDELAAYEAERKRVRQERVDNLTRKLIDRISVWTETDKGPDTTYAFNAKTQHEVENLKMESFGIDILHCE